MSILTEKDRDDLCICVTRNQHEIAPSSACPLLIAGKAVQRIIARHLGDCPDHPRSGWTRSPGALGATTETSRS